MTSAQTPGPDRRQRWRRNWTRFGAGFAAFFLVVLAWRLPGHLEQGDAGVLMRDAGLAMVCANMILQALRPGWPASYALTLTMAGASLWLAGAWKL